MKCLYNRVLDDMSIYSLGEKIGARISDPQGKVKEVI
jgi:hypothetical protein